MGLNVYVVLGSAVVGLLVGLTGAGGGSLMTPLLVLFFGIHPTTAVGTDLLFTAITARMIASQSLMSGVPDMQDRGAVMSLNNSVAQFAGGIAAGLAGLIVVQSPSGHMEHYDILGFVVAGAMAATLGLMYPIHKMVTKKAAAGGLPAGAGPGVPAAQPATASKEAGPVRVSESREGQAPFPLRRK